MPAYIIGDIEITDAAAYEAYRTDVPATIAKYGGRYHVRGGRAELLEGDRRPNRVVVLEFPSLEQAKRWYDSEEYRPLKAIRQKAARGSLLLVEGV